MDYCFSMSYYGCLVPDSYGRGQPMTWFVKAVVITSMLLVGVVVLYSVCVRLEEEIKEAKGEKND